MPPLSHCQRSVQLKAHQPLVQRVASRLRSRLPSHVEMDDLLQSGMMGLDDALNRYETVVGASFETYAARRIEGAMLDALRQVDELPRQVRARHRRLRETVRQLEQELGRPPRAQEVANALDWSLAEFHECMAQAGAGALRSDDPEGRPLDLELSSHAADTACASSDDDADPLTAVQKRQRYAALSRAFDLLEANERLVMELIYEHDTPLRQIGDALGVSSSRVCQIHEQIVAKLRRRLRDW